MAAIDNIFTNYRALSTARKDREREMRIQIDREMRAQWEAFDDLVLRAIEEGVSISKIALEMGASRTTVYQIRDRARMRHTSAVVLLDPFAGRYTWEPNGALTIRLDVADLLPSVERHDWTADTLSRAIGEGWGAQAFWVDGDTIRPLADAPATLATYGHNEPPVMLWTLDPANAAHVSDWVHEHPYTGQVAA